MSDEVKPRGLRYNAGKAKLSWVPGCLEVGVAEVLWQSSKSGGGKYPDQNWREGMPWAEVGESAARHLKSWLQEGIDLDPESGLNHLKHVATNIAILLEYLTTHPELDNRPKKPISLQTPAGCARYIGEGDIIVHATGGAGGK